MSFSLAEFWLRKPVKKKVNSKNPFGTRRYPTWYTKIIFGLMYRRSFYQQLKVFSLAGLPLEEAISILAQQAVEAKQRCLWEVLDDISINIGRRGRSFAQALKAWCPSSEILLISSGKGGNKSMAKAITKVLKMQQGIMEMRSVLISIMMEPLLIVFGTYGLIIWTATNFLSSLLATTPGIDASQFTGLAHQLVVVGKFGGGVAAFIPPIVVLLMGLAIFFSMPRWTGKIRKYVDSIPPWSIYRSVQGAGWMQAFAMLADSGVTYVEILAETASMGTPWLRERLLAARSLMIRPGMPVGDALWATGYNFPSKAVALNLKAFGARRGFDEALSEVSDEWFLSIVTSVKRASAMLGMVTLVMNTLAILWVFQASNDLTQQITQLLRAKYGG